MLEIKENGMIDGREIHRKIESQTKRFDIWANRAIDYADLSEHADYQCLYNFVPMPNGGRKRVLETYEFTIEAAKEICLLERNHKGKEIRRWLIGLDNKRGSGELLTHSEITHLLNLCKLFAYEEPRKAAEKKHFNWYNDKYTWNAYRQGLLGYSVDQLKEAILKLGVKYKNQNQAFIHIDKHRLIYNAVVDLFIALGKSEEYAKNVASFCYEVGKEHPELLTWDRKDNRLFPPSNSIRETERKYLIA